jgi:photosystem II stability/assembly factor-like uncharacterized protein
MPTNIMKITNTRIPLTILSLASACGLALAIHTGQAGSKSVAAVSSKAPGGSSSWHWQNPLPQGNNLRGASFVDANTGTVVGDYGTIVRTTDGGNSWTVQVSSTTQKLWAVSFTDVNNGTAVGEAGIILGTTDGGDHWVPQTSGTTLQLRGVSFAGDAINGTAVGEAGSLSRVGRGIHYLVFPLSIRIREQRWAERAGSAEKALF